ncbi:MAG: hypothetical protein AB7P00_14065 [Sandaracinaceae bacterium]
MRADGDATDESVRDAEPFELGVRRERSRTHRRGLKVDRVSKRHRVDLSSRSEVDRVLHGAIVRGRPDACNVVARPMRRDRELACRTLLVLHVTPERADD